MVIPLTLKYTQMTMTQYTEYELREAEGLGLSVEAIRAIRRKPPRARPKRMRGNKYVKFYDRKEQDELVEM